MSLHLSSMEAACLIGQISWLLTAAARQLAIRLAANDECDELPVVLANILVLVDGVDVATVAEQLIDTKVERFSLKKLQNNTLLVKVFKFKILFKKDILCSCSIINELNTYIFYLLQIFIILKYYIIKFN